MSHLITLIRAVRACARLRQRPAAAGGRAGAGVSDADRRRCATAARSPYTLPGLLATAVARRGDRRHGAGISPAAASAARVLRTLCRISLSPDSCVRQTESIFSASARASMIVRQVRARLRVGRDRDGRRVRPSLLEVRAVRRDRRAALGRASRSRSATSFATRSTTCSKRCNRSASGRHRLAGSSPRSSPTSRGNGGSASVHPATADGPRDGRRAARPAGSTANRRRDPRRALAAVAGGERSHPRRARHRHHADHRRPRSACTSRRRGRRLLRVPERSERGQGRADS